MELTTINPLLYFYFISFLTNNFYDTFKPYNNHSYLFNLEPGRLLKAIEKYK